MRDVSQYFMFVQNLALLPVLVVAATLLFKRVPGVSTLIMMVGAVTLIVGGWYTAAWVAVSGDTSQLSQTDIASLQTQLMIGGSISLIGLTIFIGGFLLFALHIVRSQATDAKAI